MKKMGVWIFLLVGFSFFFTGCDKGIDAGNYVLRDLELNSGDVVIDDLGTEERQLGDIEGSINETGFTFQRYTITIPKYHFKHTFSYPTQEAIALYKLPSLSSREWIQSGALALPPVYTPQNKTTYPYRYFGENKELIKEREVMLWIYDIGEDDSLANIGKTAVKIVRDFYGYDTLFTGHEYRFYQSEIAGKAKACEENHGERSTCEYIERELQYFDLLKGSGSMPKFTEGNGGELGVSQNLYGFGFGINNFDAGSEKEYDKSLPYFLKVLRDKKYPKEIWLYLQDFGGSKASQLILQ